MEIFLSENLVFFVEEKSNIEENIYKYNRTIGILGNRLVLFLVKDYILLNSTLNHVKKLKIYLFSK